MNKIILIGRLTKDPEMRTTNTGKKVASFSIAVNDGKDQDGKTKAQFFNCTAWDRLADIVESFAGKGKLVCVSGPLKFRSYEKSDGTQGHSHDISLNDFHMLTTKAESQAMQQEPDQDTTRTIPNKFDPADVPEIDVNDIKLEMPF